MLAWVGGRVFWLGGRFCGVARFWAFWLGECLVRGFVLLVFPGWCSLCAVGGVGAVELWCVFVRCCFISSDVWCAW